MARLIGPDEAYRLTYDPRRGRFGVPNVTVEVYEDEALTTPATDLLTLDGDPHTTGLLTSNATGKLEQVQYPDGLDTIWAKYGTTAVPLRADVDARLDALDLATGEAAIEAVIDAKAAAGDILTPAVASGTYVASEDGVTFTWDGTPVDLGGSGNGLPSNVTTRTSAYTAAAGDFVLADATSAGFTVTLPAAPTAGQLVTVKKTDATANAVTVVGQGGDTIDGDANATIVAKGAGAVFAFDGSNWQVHAVTSAQGTDGEGVPTGGADGQVLAKASADDYDTEWIDLPAGGGGLLGYTERQPAGNDELSNGTTSFTDVHADLAVTFTVPASGQVIVTLNAIARANSGTGIWGLREGTTTVVDLGYIVAVNTYGRYTARKRITGLTPGATLTWKWAHRNTGGTVFTSMGVLYGPAVMEVWAA